MEIASHSRRPSRTVLAAPLLIVLALLSAPATAQGPQRPAGLPAGPWFLAPYIGFAWQQDDNLFRRSAEFGFEPRNDRIFIATAGLNAELPFRQSRLRVGYELANTEFDRTERLDSELTQDFVAELELAFSSGDHLTLSERYTRGLSDVQRIDEGGELVFEGQPYRLNEWEVELSRRSGGRPGYDFRLTGMDLDYEDTASVSYFDFRRLDGYAGYSQPISPHSWFEIGYQGRREDEFLEDGPRRERSDMLLVGLRGQLGRGNDASLRLGHEHFRFEGVAGSEFRGLVGMGRLQVGLGPRGSVALSYQRRALPSFFDTHYLATYVTLRFEHRWRARSAWGADMQASANRYAGELDWNRDGRSFRREDELYSGELFLTVGVGERVAMRLSARRQRRDSNFVRSEYEATVYSAGIQVGWNE